LQSKLRGAIKIITRDFVQVTEGSKEGGGGVFKASILVPSGGEAEVDALVSAQAGMGGAGKKTSSFKTWDKKRGKQAHGANRGGGKS